MRKLLLTLFLAPSFLFSVDDWNYPIFELENTPPPFYSFSLSGQYLDVGKAHLRTPGLKDREITYRQAELAFSYTHPFNEICGLIFGAGWVGADVKLEKNPEFSATNFNYVNFSIGCFTQSFPDWTWTLTLAAFLDTEEFSLADYTLYQGVLWGKYAFYKWIELNLGMILELGLNKEKVWPIFGLVLLPSPKWNLNLVYPINIAFEYQWTSCWKIAGSIRFLRNRHRVEPEEPNPQGIFEYDANGAELDLIFTPLRNLLIKGFSGHTFKGDLKVSNRNNHHAHHYKFKGSFYAGASAVLSF